MIDFTNRASTMLATSVLAGVLALGCDDTTIYPILSSTVDLPAGSSECLAGGTRIDFGYDDGSGDGSRSDGILHPDEVTTSQVVCHDDAHAPPIAQEAPPGAPGTNRIDVSGGAGSTTSGGAGGQFALNSSTGSVSSYVFRTGSVAAEVSLPSFDVALGDTPVEIAADTTLTELPGMPSDGVYYDDGGGRLVVVSGGTPTTATGLHVAAGATLTLPSPADLTFGAVFAADVHLEGTLAVASGSDLGSIAIQANDYFAAAGSQVELVAAADAVANYQVTASGRLLSGSNIDGYAGASMGQGGGIVGLVATTGSLVQTGDIDVRGDDDASNGGSGGSIALVAGGSAFVSGRLDASGGAGDSTAGPGGSVLILAGTSYSGSVVASVQADASGGDAAAAGAGGSGGAIQVQGVGGNITLNGSFLAEGGDGLDGGSGGALSISTFVGSLPAGPSFGPKQVLVDADLGLGGGDGETGGAGGSLTATVDSFGIAAIAFYGVQSISLEGGASSAGTGGGQGGTMSTFLGPTSPPIGVGSIVLRTDVIATGGAGGGAGGNLSLNNIGSTHDWVGSLSADVPTFLLEGSVDVSAGVDGAAPGGSIFLQTARDVSIEGSMTANGATSSDDMDNGGGGGALVLGTFSGAIGVAGDLEVRGGDGLDGGFGGTMSVGSSLTTIDGDVLATGGDGAVNGGGGGSLVIASAQGPSVVSGILSVAGGAGGSGADGVDGNLNYDGL